MLRGSVWMCGLPAACTSPCERSSCVGTSSLGTTSAARKCAGWSGCSRALPDCCSSTGSQPISSSAPVHTNRSALRARAIRLGRAWIWCGSCSAVVATDTSTSGPPSSCTSAPHSGSQASTRSAACDGAANAHNAASNKRTDESRFIMGCPASIPVRAVRAEAHLVLQHELVVGGAEARLVARELQPHARELARVVVNHQRVLLRLEAVGAEQPGARAVLRRAGVEPFGARAHAPARHELIHRLHVGAVLRHAQIA